MREASPGVLKETREQGIAIPWRTRQINHFVRLGGSQLTAAIRQRHTSYSPVEAPEGTVALPQLPLISHTSTSTVGLPRESNTCLALTALMCGTGGPVLLLSLPLQSPAGRVDSKQKRVAEAYQALPKMQRCMRRRRVILDYQRCGLLTRVSEGEAFGGSIVESCWKLQKFEGPWRRLTWGAICARVQP